MQIILYINNIIKLTNKLKKHLLKQSIEQDKIITNSEIKWKDYTLKQTHYMKVIKVQI